MVDYSNPSFVRAQNAARVRSAIESFGRNFETFPAVNLTDSDIYTMAYRLKPLSMDQIRENVCSEISIIPDQCDLYDLDVLSLSMSNILSLPEKILNTLGVSSQDASYGTILEAVQNSTYKSQAFDDAFEYVTGSQQTGSLGASIALFNNRAKAIAQEDNDLFNDVLSNIGKIVNGPTSAEVMQPSTAENIKQEVEKLYDLQVAENESAYGANGILKKLGITPTPENSNTDYILNAVQDLIDAEKSFFSKIAFNSDLYEKYEMPELPTKAGAIVDQIRYYQKPIFAMKMFCKWYVTYSGGLTLTDQQASVRESCVQLKDATSKENVGTSISDFCTRIMFNPATSSVAQWVVPVVTDKLGNGMQSIPLYYCNHFAVVSKLDDTSALRVKITNPTTLMAWGSGGLYGFNNYYPVELQLLDEILTGSDYPWLTFD